MKRQAFLAAGLTALAAPTAALARQPGDGYPTIPYQPKNAFPYYDPITELKREHVDRKIWPAVRRINQSGWVWTAESCQGHNDGFSDSPLLRLVYRKADESAVINALLDSMPNGVYQLGGRLLEGGAAVRIRKMPSPRGWAELHATVEWGGVRVFERFAERING